MTIASNFTTLPELFINIIEKYKNQSERPLLRHKINNSYIDISYKKVLEETELLSYGLASLNVKRDDKVSIISENRPEWLYSDFAILSLGAIDVPLYPILTSENICFILNNSESKGIIVSNQFHLNKILKIWKDCKHLKFIIVLNDIDLTNYKDKEIYTFEEIKNRGKLFQIENKNLLIDNIKLTKEDDVATIIYTSGTTGEPKGVILTHKNIVSNIKAANEVLSVSDKDIFLSFLPLCHIFERTGGYYTAFSAGATICYAESIEKLSQNLMETKPTIMTAVPRFFERLYSRIKKNVETQSLAKQKIFNWALKVGIEFYKNKNNQSPNSFKLKIEQKLADKLVFSKLKEKTGGNLRFFVSGGAALSRELGEFFEAIGMVILEGYGLTESSPVITVNRLHDYKFGTVGKPLPSVEVKIAKDGEILVAGPNVMQGYFRNKKETDSTLKNGWLHTGDIGVFDAEGFLIITDRKKHLFKTSGGKYIAPTPIENLFLASKYIDQFILIGDRRMFLSALIVPDYEALKEYADANRIHYSDIKELVSMKQINELLEKEFDQFQKKLSSYERIRRFTLLDKPFSIETGELTPSLKLKRKVIEERYSNLIDDMYADLG